MKLLFIVCCSLLMAPVMAQTKKIAYKSHSGAESNFATALDERLFDMDHSNFGVAPTELVRHAKLDSVIFVCDTVAIMVTSEYCTRILRHSRETQGEPRLWNPGKMEVKNHPLFSRQHSLDSIRNVIRTQYNFQNPIEKVVFVGYDNAGDKPVTRVRKQKPKEGVIGMITDRKPPLDNTGWTIFAGILVISLCGGWIAWYLRSLQKSAGKDFAPAHA
ncbi:MAG: hypothetical protein NTW29_19200 [Bacteroidetes bacterium]|nr:hypothetical protein [Bacteroidota bacterium]